VCLKQLQLQSLLHFPSLVPAEKSIVLLKLTQSALDVSTHMPSPSNAFLQPASSHVSEVLEGDVVIAASVGQVGVAGHLFVGHVGIGGQAFVGQVGIGGQVFAGQGVCSGTVGQVGVAGHVFVGQVGVGGQVVLGGTVGQLGMAGQVLSGQVGIGGQVGTGGQVAGDAVLPQLIF